MEDQIPGINKGGVNFSQQQQWLFGVQVMGSNHWKPYFPTAGPHLHVFSPLHMVVRQYLEISMKYLLIKDFKLAANTAIIVIIITKIIKIETIVIMYFSHPTITGIGAVPSWGTQQYSLTQRQTLTFKTRQEQSTILMIPSSLYNHANRFSTKLVPVRWP